MDAILLDKISFFLLQLQKVYPGQRSRHDRSKDLEDDAAPPNTTISKRLWDFPSGHSPWINPSTKKKWTGDGI